MCFRVRFAQYYILYEPELRDASLDCPTFSLNMLCDLFLYRDVVSIARVVGGAAADKSFFSTAVGFQRPPPLGS